MSEKWYKEGSCSGLEDVERRLLPNGIFQYRGTCVVCDDLVETSPEKPKGRTVTFEYTEERLRELTREHYEQRRGGRKRHSLKLLRD